MKRVILDTNVYGEIIRQEDVGLVLDSLPKAGLIVYGSQVIRKELRNVPKTKLTVSEGRKRRLRGIILGLYDSVVRKDLNVTADILKIAKNYYSAFRSLGGATSQERLLNDFIIVALASKNGLDIIYSNDSETLVSDMSKKAYRVVNEILKIRTPDFRKYGDFIDEIKK